MSFLINHLLVGLIPFNRCLVLFMLIIDFAQSAVPLDLHTQKALQISTGF